MELRWRWQRAPRVAAWFLIILIAGYVARDHIRLPWPETLVALLIVLLLMAGVAAATMGVKRFERAAVTVAVALICYAGAYLLRDCLDFRWSWLGLGLLLMYTTTYAFVTGDWWGPRGRWWGLAGKGRVNF